MSKNQKTDQYGQLYTYTDKEIIIKQFEKTAKAVKQIVKKDKGTSKTMYNRKHAYTGTW